MSSYKLLLKRASYKTSYRPVLIRSTRSHLSNPVSVLQALFYCSVTIFRKDAGARSLMG